MTDAEASNPYFSPLGNEHLENMSLPSSPLQGGSLFTPPDSPSDSCLSNTNPSPQHLTSSLFTPSPSPEPQTRLALGLGFRREDKPNKNLEVGETAVQNTQLAKEGGVTGKGKNYLNTISNMATFP